MIIDDSEDSNTRYWQGLESLVQGILLEMEGEQAPEPITRSLRVAVLSVDEECNIALNRYLRVNRHSWVFPLDFARDKVVSDTQLQVALNEVTSGEIIVCIIGEPILYDPGNKRSSQRDKSLLELGYEKGRQSHIPMFVYLQEEPDSLKPRQQPDNEVLRFRQRVVQEHLVRSFHSAEDLVTQIGVDLERAGRADVSTQPKSIEQVGPADIPWVLIAGTGLKNKLSKKLAKTCEDLGGALARSGFGLITGGWPGVDAATSRSFVEELDKLNIEAQRRLVHVLGKDDRPSFDRGEVVYVENGVEEYEESVRRAKFVILIGGAGGTRTMGEYALQAGLIVLPFKDTGGDARRFHERLAREQPVEKRTFVNDELLATLSKSAPSVVDEVITLLQRLAEGHVRSYS